MTGRFAGKVAVITGGASGIGRATALALASEGCSVAIADINDERLKSTANEIREAGAKCLAVRCDVSSDAQVDELAERTFAAFGDVDILMNNAGVMLRGKPEEMPLDEWEWIFGINVFGVVRGIRAFLPRMIERGSGHVVNTASIGGLVGGRWHSASYSSSKFAVVGLSETLFVYLKRKGIGVSVLCPGGVRTNLNEGIRFSRTVDDPEKFGGSEEFGPQAVEPDDVARLVLDAIETKRFMILTDPRLQSMLVRKAENIQSYLDIRANSGI